MKEFEIGLVETKDSPTTSFDWGIMKWLVTPKMYKDAGFSVGLLVLFPGMGHERHNHADSEELLYVLDGVGEQTVDDGEAFRISGGDSIYLPQGVHHSTHNVGWEPMRILAIYRPSGPEEDFRTLPDFKEIAAGVAPKLIRGDIE